MNDKCRVLCVFSEPPKVEEPEKWEEQRLSTVELFIKTHNKNPVETVSPNITAHTKVLTQSCSTPSALISAFNVLFSIYFALQRINDSLMICAEPDNFTVGEFITVGSVVLVVGCEIRTQVHC